MYCIVTNIFFFWRYKRIYFGSGIRKKFFGGYEKNQITIPYLAWHLFSFLSSGKLPPEDTHLLKKQCQGLELGRVHLITIYSLYSTASVVAQSIEFVSAGLRVGAMVVEIYRCWRTCWFFIDVSMVCYDFHLLDEFERETFIVFKKFRQFGSIWLMHFFNSA